MSRIIISNLFPAGFEFFQDTENFLHDLTASELAVTGGLSIIASLSIASLPFAFESLISDPNYPSQVQTKVTVSVAVSLKTTSVLTFG